MKEIKKIDIEAKLFMYILHLKEEKSIEYSTKECERNKMELLLHQRNNVMIP